ncbi:MAG TPA: uracil-DNA glycosylase family protein, partial [Anaerovoracaceae bacterium]|nr:uracil-DNA glycosylase family protein [Anaerovoracaceae bacterium]
MLTKPDGCNSCPLKDKGKGFVPDLTYPNSKYIIFGEAPGKNEIEEGKPFVGKAGFVLKNWLLRVVPQLQLAEEKKKVSYMNILKCLPPE